MNALLDTLGATVAGGLILLMIFSSITNMQVMSFNMQQQAILNKISEDLISGRSVNNIDYPGLGFYLSKVGAGVPANPIVEAVSNSFKFQGKLTPFAGISTFHITSGAAVNGVYPLYIYVDNMSTPVQGPFWMADSLNITYYDEFNVEIADPNNHRTDIRSAMFSFNFTLTTFRPDIDKRLVRYPMVYWKYFKNLYL